MAFDLSPIFALIERHPVLAILALLGVLVTSFAHEVLSSRPRIF